MGVASKVWTMLPRGQTAGEGAAGGEVKRVGSVGRRMSVQEQRTMSSSKLSMATKRH